MRLTAILTIFAVLLTPLLVRADDCPYRDGGYCVVVFTATTSGVIANWISIDKKEVPSSGGGLLNYYESLWDEMIKAKKATQEEKEQVFAEARKSGGTKIGGVNLVVLSAGTLQHLVDKKVMTKEEAQQILNEAKKHD